MSKWCWSERNYTQKTHNQSITKKKIYSENIFTIHCSSITFVLKLMESKGLLRFEKPFPWLNALIFNELLSRKRLVNFMIKAINNQTKFWTFLLEFDDRIPVTLWRQWSMMFITFKIIFWNENILRTLKKLGLCNIKS